MRLLSIRSSKLSGFIGFFLFMTLALLLGPAHAHALNYTDHPMDDSLFRASYTMSSTDIQNFLVSQHSGLANFSDVEDCGSPAGAHYAFYTTYYTCGTRQVAAQIIYDASQAYGINPQAILATMQKEQSLVTTPNPTASQLNYAMGYGCPDSGGCSYAGFFNQVDNGTWQFRTDYELSSGNNYWGYAPSSFPCNGPTRYYNAALLPGHGVTFIDDYGTGYASFVIPNASTATLYCYTPHVWPGSSQEYYSGSYWFVYYYSLWFGTSTAPFAFKSPTSATVYLYVNGSKVSVPAMGMLQDFGVNPNAIQTWSQSKVDAIPTGGNGISSTLSYLVTSSSTTDADGNAVYLVTVGKKYHVTSVEQMNDFGFSFSNVASLPLSFIQSLPGSSALSNYISTPTSSAFQISGGQKKIIFDYPTYISLNPSNNATPVSYYTADLVPSGSPIANREIGVRYSGSDVVYLYLNNNYYTVSTINAYNCWGFNSTLHTPVYTLSDNSYVATINPVSTLSSCLFNDGAGNTTLLSRSNRYTVPSSYGISSAQAPSQDIINLANKLPSGGTLKQYINDPQTSAVWTLGNGKKTVVPTYSNFVLLDINSSVLSAVDDSAVSSIPTSSDIKLGSGQVVKVPGADQVYAISGNGRIVYASGDDFLAYGNGWGSIETYSQATLNQDYPYSNQTVSKYFYDQPSSSLYLVDVNDCYKLSSSLQSSYGQNQNSIAGSQSYTSAAFPHLNLNACKNGSVYVKQPGVSTVYWIDGGTKHPVSDWNKLVQQSGTNNPYIINLSNSTLQTFTTGSVL